MQIRLRCEVCKERELVVTYDASTSVVFKSFDCPCGHTTEIKAWPPKAGERGQNIEGNEAVGKARDV